MSTFRVSVVEIDQVSSHSNADRLEIVTIVGMDWQCVTGKGLYKSGDKAVYFPIDSILPEEIESMIFGPDSKVKLNNHRVKTIKLRGAISQGLVATPSSLKLPTRYSRIGDDVTSFLGITKYEPPVKLSSLGGGKSTKNDSNPHFTKYTGIENAKNYNNIFEEGEMVCVTEKIHGTNFRCGYVPFHANTLFKKVKAFLGLAPKYEFVYGSHNRQLQSKLLYTGYYDTNVYAEAVVKYNLKEILKPGETLYGEVYGDGIQGGYSYGCKPGERKLVVFDLKKDNKYVNSHDFISWCIENDLPMVPILFGQIPFNKEKILSLRDGDSVLAPSQKVREGIVVKPIEETTCYIGRKMLKYISDNYLLKNQDNEDEAH